LKEPRPTAPKNRGLALTIEDRERLAPALEAARALGSSTAAISAAEASDAIILGDSPAVLSKLPAASIDLLIADPPYNMNKDFGEVSGRVMEEKEYEEYTRRWVEAALPLLKPEASVYVCCDWRCSGSVARALEGLGLGAAVEQ